MVGRDRSCRWGIEGNKLLEGVRNVAEGVEDGEGF